MLSKNPHCTIPEAVIIFASQSEGAGRHLEGTSVSWGMLSLEDIWGLVKLYTSALMGTV